MNTPIDRRQDSSSSADLLDSEVGPPKQVRPLAPVVYWVILFATIPVVLLPIQVAGIALSRTFQVDWIEPVSRWVAITLGMVLPRVLDHWLRRRGYRLPRPDDSLTTLEERAPGSVAASLGNSKKEDQIPSESVVCRSDLRLLASLGAICFAIALTLVGGVVAAHLNNANPEPVRVGILSSLAACMVLLGGVGFWFGFGSRWETRFDRAGITRVRLDWTRFIPWSDISRIAIVQRDLPSKARVTITLCFGSTAGKSIRVGTLTTGQIKEVERILALVDARRPDLHIDP